MFVLENNGIADSRYSSKSIIRLSIFVRHRSCAASASSRQETKVESPADIYTKIDYWKTVQERLRISAAPRRMVHDK